MSMNVALWRKLFLSFLLSGWLLALSGSLHAQTTPPAPHLVMGSVTGQVIQGTDGATLPPDLSVTLHIIDAAFGEQTTTTSIDAEGHFAFANIPIASAYKYYASTLYQDRAFASVSVSGDIAAPDLELYVVIYTTTNDPAVISIIDISTRIDPAEGRPDALRVVQLMRFRNNSDQLFVGAGILADGRAATLGISLPIGAVVVELENNSGFVFDDFVIDETNFTITDTHPVPPGDEYFIYATYLLPYRDAAIIEYPVTYPLAGPVRVLVDSDTLTLSSEQLSTLGPESSGGQSYLAYGSTLRLNPSDLIRYDLVGGLPGATATDSASATSSNHLLVFLVGVVVVLGIMVIGLVVITRNNHDVVAG